VRVAALRDIEKAAASIGYPVVLKPVRSVGQGQGRRRVQLAVTYARNPRELRFRAESLLRFGEIVLQERFDGRGVGIELIADRGSVVYAFQHVRLHELPLSGGGSSLRRSASVDPALLEAATRLVGALQWHGVAMIEFKQDDQTGAFRLMEINGRLWGSLPLALACGADFPGMMYDLYTRGQVSPPPPARDGMLCRKLSDDLYWYELVIRRIDPTGLVRFPSAATLIKDAVLCFSPRHRFDVQQLRDPKPGLVDVGRIAARYGARLSEQWRERSVRGAQRSRWRKGQVHKAMENAGSVLFLCHGNINRSVLAQRALEKHLTGSGLKVSSAGFHPQSGRPADPVMRELASRAGIDLSDCRSRTVSREMLSGADIVFVMEWTHLRRIRDEFPDAAEKCFLLGCAVPGGGPVGDIADPYGKAIGDYEHCFRQVTDSVQEIAAGLGRRADQ
jgi:protein-tyrosine-phosphatase